MSPINWILSIDSSINRLQLIYIPCDPALTCCIHSYVLFFFSEQILIEIQNKYSSWSKVIEEISGPKVSMRCNELISWIFAMGKLLLHCQIRAYNPEKKICILHFDMNKTTLISSVLTTEQMLWVSGFSNFISLKIFVSKFHLVQREFPGFLQDLENLGITYLLYYFAWRRKF